LFRMFLGIYNLPNLITLIGLSLSVWACYFSFTNNLNLAVIFFMYSGICDLFDGAVARKLKLTEDEKAFGAQLDSIVDMVSFGLTPVVIAFQFLGIGTILRNNMLDLVIFSLYACCAAMRLAYFNIYGTQKVEGKSYFTGLPVTSSALIFPLVYALIVMFWFISPHMAVIRGTFLLLSFMFVVKIPIPKPQGIFYVIFPILALFVTVFWLLA